MNSTSSRSAAVRRRIRAFGAGAGQGDLLGSNPTGRGTANALACTGAGNNAAFFCSGDFSKARTFGFRTGAGHEAEEDDGACHELPATDWAVADLSDGGFIGGSRWYG